jgi:hypothetical protein
MSYNLSVLVIRLPVLFIPDKIKNQNLLWLWFVAFLLGFGGHSIRETESLRFLPSLVENNIPTYVAHQKTGCNAPPASPNLHIINIFINSNIPD